MTLIAQNIKRLRKHHKLTQDQFANKLGIKRSSIGAYEEGRAEPPIQNLSNIARTFDVSIDSLVNDDIAPKLGLDPLTGQKTDRARSFGDVQLKVLAITVDSEDRENIEFVPNKASAGYLNGYSDPTFLSELPKFHLPNLPTGTYRAFEISGDSMLPVLPGSVIIGKYLETLSDLKEGNRYIVLSRTEGIVFKRLFGKKTEQLKLISDNPLFEPYEMAKEDIIEIWSADMMISSNIPEPGLENPTLNSIEKKLNTVEKDVTFIRDKLIK